MARQDHKDATNERVVTEALADFAKRLHETLRGNPDLHGSIALTVHCAFGSIKKFNVTTDETKLCQG